MTCYLLHFDSPIGTAGKGAAQHYLGSSATLGARLAHHASADCDVKILRECRRLGIGWSVARTWPGGRARERQLKSQGGFRDLCPLCGTTPAYWEAGEMKRGGYAAVAAEINKRFAPQPPLDRRQVYRWDKVQSRNQAGERPPAPVEIRSRAARTTPRRVFEIEDWVDWYRAGTRGPNGKGWLVRVEIGSEPPMEDVPVAAGLL